MMQIQPCPSKQLLKEPRQQPKLPPFVFEHDAYGELTTAGYAAFDAKDVIYTASLLAYEHETRQLYAYLQTTLTDRAKDSLKLHPQHSAVAQSKNIAKFRALLDATFQTNTGVFSLTSLHDLINLKRKPGQQTDGFHYTLRMLVRRFAATYESAEHPGTVSIDLLHLLLLLLNQPTENQPFVDNLLMHEIHLLKLSPVVVETRIRAYEQNRKELTRTIRGPADKPSQPPGSRTAKSPSNDTHNALATTGAPAPANTRSRPTGPATGDTPEYCPHCYDRTGRKFNNHGHGTLPACNSSQRSTTAHTTAPSQAHPVPAATEPAALAAQQQAGLATQRQAALASQLLAALGVSPRYFPRR